MTVREILALAAFAAGFLFGTLGIIGLFRFPDAYSRLQAGSLCGTTAVFSIFLGALALSPGWEVSTRLLVIMVFFLISAPIGSHIVLRFIWNSGVSPWSPRRKPERPERKQSQP
ncbi:MAG: cation:proton antiporter [Spirochaetales bacterium]|nr:MAG: cation:proton antiporter [Spirochaetales bacterium]